MAPRVIFFLSKPAEKGGEQRGFCKFFQMVFFNRNFFWRKELCENYLY